MTGDKLAVSQEARVAVDDAINEWTHQMDNYLPAPGESGQLCSERRLRSTLLDAFARFEAQARAAGERQWQDIASAPKDGTVILLAFEDSGEIIVRSGGFCEETGAPVVPDSDWPFIEPFAWMPLPEPPAASTGEIG